MRTQKKLQKRRTLTSPKLMCWNINWGEDKNGEDKKEIVATELKKYMTARYILALQEFPDAEQEGYEEYKSQADYIKRAILDSGYRYVHEATLLIAFPKAFNKVAAGTIDLVVNTTQRKALYIADPDFAIVCAHLQMDAAQSTKCCRPYGSWGCKPLLKKGEIQELLLKSRIQFANGGGGTAAGGAQRRGERISIKYFTI